MERIGLSAARIMLNLLNQRYTDTGYSVFDYGRNADTGDWYAAMRQPDGGIHLLTYPDADAIRRAMDRVAFAEYDPPHHRDENVPCFACAAAWNVQTGTLAHAEDCYWIIAVYGDVSGGVNE